MPDFDIEVIVSTPRFTVCRNVPADPQDQTWFTVRVTPLASLSTYEEIRQYLPEDGSSIRLEDVMVVGDEGDVYFDWVQGGS